MIKKIVKFHFITWFIACMIVVPIVMFLGYIVCPIREGLKAFYREYRDEVLNTNDKMEAIYTKPVLKLWRDFKNG